MVNAAPTPTSRPGAAYWLLVLVGLPAAGVEVILKVQFSARGGGFHGGIWLVSVAVIALVAAALLPLLPRLRAMARRARVCWALAGAALAVLLAYAYTVGLFLAVLIIGCRFFGDCLT